MVRRGSLLLVKFSMTFMTTSKAVWDFVLEPFANLIHEVMN
jgi:hypothetical protein